MSNRPFQQMKGIDLDLVSYSIEGLNSSRYRNLTVVASKQLVGKPRNCVHSV